MPLLSQLAMGAATLLGGGAVSMTLMACYGPACVNEVCDYDEDPTASHRITDAEVQQLQELIAAGRWTGTGEAEAECSVTAEGNTSPRSVTLTFAYEGQPDAKISIVADETEVSQRSTSGFDYILGEGAVVTVRGSAGTPSEVTYGASEAQQRTCSNLKR